MLTLCFMKAIVSIGFYHIFLKADFTKLIGCLTIINEWHGLFHAVLS